MQRQAVKLFSENLLKTPSLRRLCSSTTLDTTLPPKNQSKIRELARRRNPQFQETEKTDAGRKKGRSRVRSRVRSRDRILCKTGVRVDLREKERAGRRKERSGWSARSLFIFPANT